MNNTLLDTVAACSKDLMKFGFSVEEFATLVQENNMTDAEVLAVAKVFEHLKAKKDSSTVDFLLRTSRLPLKVPKTFENFDFSRITGKNIDKLRNLSKVGQFYIPLLVRRVVVTRMISCLAALDDDQLTGAFMHGVAQLGKPLSQLRPKALILSLNIPVMVPAPEVDKQFTFVGVDLPLLKAFAPAVRCLS